MLIRSSLFLLAWLALTPLALTGPAPLTLPLGTSFTYQGRLDNSYDPNETVNLSFKLWTHPTSMNALRYQVGSGFTASVPGNNANRVIWTDLVDFGAAPFNGQASFLEVYISPHNQPNAALIDYVMQTPRIRLAPTPNAIYASTAGTVTNGAIQISQLGTVGLPSAGQLLGYNGSSLVWQDPASGAWAVGGNTASAGNFLGTLNNQPLEFKVNNQRALRLEPTGSGSVNVIGGWMGNSVGAGVVGATIGGGGASGFFYANRVEADFGTVSGGSQNQIRTGAAYATIGGGYGNLIENDSQHATIGGGRVNVIWMGALAATIGGGGDNLIWTNAAFATIGGGHGNTIEPDSSDATIGGGAGNTIRTNAHYATIPGGQFNSATNYAFAAGRYAKANHTGAFVWADSTAADFASTRNNQFNIRASGGVRLSDDTPNLSFGSQRRQMINLWGTLYGIGVQDGTLYQRCEGNPNVLLGGFRWYKGGTHREALGDAGGGTEMMSLTEAGLFVRGAFVSVSDRNAKENFKPVDARAVLDKVATLPLSEWNYKADTASRHLGPMAQDFYAAFQVGPDDKHITTVDESGVALAAIQGLNQKVDSEIATLRAENAALQQRLEKLEQLMNRQNGGGR